MKLHRFYDEEDSKSPYMRGVARAYVGLASLNDLTLNEYLALPKEEQRRRAEEEETWLLRGMEGQTVYMHLNLGHKWDTQGLGTWSVKYGPDRKLVGHIYGARLRDVSFEIAPSACMEAVVAKNKTVHAFANGILEKAYVSLEDLRGLPDLSAAVAIRYSPDRSGHLFFVRQDKTPVSAASLAFLIGGQGRPWPWLPILAYEVKDMSQGEIQRGLLARREAYLAHAMEWEAIRRSKDKKKMRGEGRDAADIERALDAAEKERGERYTSMGLDGESFGRVGLTTIPSKEDAAFLRAGGRPLRQVAGRVGGIEEDLVLASNVETPRAVLNEIYKRYDYGKKFLPIREALAQNPNASAEMLLALSGAEDSERRTRDLVLANPAWPLFFWDNPYFLADIVRKERERPPIERGILASHIGLLLSYPVYQFDRYMGGSAQGSLSPSFNVILYGNGMCAITDRNRSTYITDNRFFLSVDDLISYAKKYLFRGPDAELDKEIRARISEILKNAKVLGRVGLTVIPSSEDAATESIDRAYAWWLGGVGAVSRREDYLRRGIPPPESHAKTRKEIQNRRAYIESLSMIKETPRDPSLEPLGVVDWYAAPSLMREIYRLFGRSPGYYNYIVTAESATDAEWDYWTHWYHMAHEDIEFLAAKHDVALPIVAAIVAVLSPGNTWNMNLAAADYLLAGRALRLSPEEVTKGVTSFPANAKKALAMLRAAGTDALNGPKVEPFFMQLVDPENNQNFATIDGHMINLWLGVDLGVKGAPHLTRAEHAELRKDLDAAAQLFSGSKPVHTQELQALLWYLWKCSTSQQKIPANLIRGAEEALRERILEKAEEIRARKSHIYRGLERYMHEHPHAHPDLFRELQRLRSELGIE